MAEQAEAARPQQEPLGQPANVRQVRFETTAGSFTATVDRALSPNGVDRFLELVGEGFFADMLLYRVIPGFLVQFGIASEPATMAKWDGQKIADEPRRADFQAGTLSYAGSGADSRSCHFFVALAPSGLRLGKAKHESPIGVVDAAGVAVFEAVARNFEESGYPPCKLYRQLVAEGNAAAASFPRMDRILSAALLPTQQQAEADAAI